MNIYNESLKWTNEKTDLWIYEENQKIQACTSGSLEWEDSWRLSLKIFIEYKLKLDYIICRRTSSANSTCNGSIDLRYTHRQTAEIANIVTCQIFCGVNDIDCSLEAVMQLNSRPSAHVSGRGLSHAPARYP